MSDRAVREKRHREHATVTAHASQPALEQLEDPVQDDWSPRHDFFQEDFIAGSSALDTHVNMPEDRFEDVGDAVYMAPAVSSIVGNRIVRFLLSLTTIWRPMRT